MDENPLIGGKGAEILKNHHIEVKEGISREDCEKLNQVFSHYIQTKRPFAVVKYGMTMDGKIAARTGESR